VLVLSRKCQESLVLKVPGYDAEIRIVYLGQSKYGNAIARIGVVAPLEVVVERDDIGRRGPPPRRGRQTEGDGKETGNELGS
jgi:sRNA-binding carbon storage regulator CsrA